MPDAARYRNEHELPLERKKDSPWHYSYSWLSEHLGLPAGTWDRQVRSYCCCLLSDLISFKVTEKEQSFLDTDEAASSELEMRPKADRELSSVQEDQDEFLQSMRRDLLAPPDASSAAKKHLALVEFSLQQPKTESHTKRYLGETYKQPMVLSLLSVPDGRLVGVKVCLFMPESLAAKNYFLPLTFAEPLSSPKTTAFVQAFRDVTNKLAEDHLVVSQEHNLDARRAPGDKRLYSFLLYQLVPFEILLTWRACQLKLRTDHSAAVANAVSTIARLRTVGVSRYIALAGLPKI